MDSSKFWVDFTNGKEIITKTFTNWTSGNEMIDNFIQEMQLKMQLEENRFCKVFEWVPYNELIIDKKIEDNYLTKAIWKKGPLYYYEKYGEIGEWIRESYGTVTLRFLYDSQNITDEFINKVKSYLNDRSCGITQNPYTKVYILVFEKDYFDKYCKKCDNKYEDNRMLCKSCEMNRLKNHLKNNFINWTSGNEKIDDFIQEKQLKYNLEGAVFEWIPYDDLFITEVIRDNWLATAIWKDGPSIYDHSKKKLIKKSCEAVCLKYLHNTDNFLNEIESHLYNDYENYGLSQNPDTKVYILIFSNEYFEKCCDKCAIWKDGPLIYNEDKKRLVKESYKVVCLRYLYNSSCITNEFLNEVESYLKGDSGYGLSQNPDTKIYISVFSNEYYENYCDNCGNKYEVKRIKLCKPCKMNHMKTNWTSGNEKIDDIIKEKQLKSYYYDNTVFEWIPYDEFIDIKEKGDNLATAIWKDGPLIYDDSEKKLIRKSCERVYLKYLHNSLNIIEFLNKIKYSSSSRFELGFYGLSQNPETEVYILVLHDYPSGRYCGKCFDRYNNKYEWCKACQINNLKNDFTKWTSGDNKIDNFIQERQSMINEHYDTIFEWISYNEFIDIKEIDRENGFATAIWRDGPLYYSIIKGKYRRKINEKVPLKYMHNLQNVESFLNEVTYSIEESHGVSQSPNTKDFILVLQTKYYCEHCGKRYDNQFEIDNKSCMLCQINHENKKINDLIKAMRLNIDHNSMYSRKESHYWERKPNIKVALKCLHNSQNFLDEFINEVKAYSNQRIGNILKIYGISQNPKTKDYIMVLEYAEGGSFNTYLNENYKNFDWFKGLKILIEIIKGLNKIHLKEMVHQDFHIGNILFTKMEKFYDDDDQSVNSYDADDIDDTDDSTDDNDNVNDDNTNNDNNNNNYYSACISDMGLCKKVDDINETSIYGVMPYVAPEVLKGKPYTQAADIYSFGMIMYVVATGKHPFANCAHDEALALNICNGIKPEINDQIAPKCYIDLMKRCWDSNPENRPITIEVKEAIKLFYNSLNQKFNKKKQHHEIEEQFKKTQVHRTNFLSNKSNRSTIHTEAVYTSRLLNSFTGNLSKYDNIDNNTVEITDFTK
ncbi:kinase-like domain-containing protein [Rhizophagus clarus]|uniref:Kinase-like domain-containing protein n=1 Tax=Rhizophagus clarus TaxID=94130 RepID=A0A8H3QLM8_9GLOM|nr:kinase-like domain-containing protein [Rhizophagus clarus]